MREECVAHAILDVAFAKEAPPPALNLVNPRSAPWVDVIDYIRNCIIKEKGLASDALPIVPFADWFALLEKSAEGASKDELVKIVSARALFPFVIDPNASGSLESNCSSSSARWLSETKSPARDGLVSQRRVV
jgi:hypothetical protein